MGSFLTIPRPEHSLPEMVQKIPPAAFLPLHAASVILCLPGHLAFEFAEGYMFGFEKGFALAYASKSLGALSAFGLGRWFCESNGRQAWILDKLREWPTAAKVAAGVERGGALSVALIRMAPVPCVVKNYSLTFLTQIPWTVYVPATLVGLLPTTAIHVYIGASAPSPAELATNSGAAMHAL